MATIVKWPFYILGSPDKFRIFKSVIFVKNVEKHEDSISRIDSIFRNDQVIAKKPPEIVQNLKIWPNTKFFFEILKNYSCTL